MFIRPFITISLIIGLFLVTSTAFSEPLALPSWANSGDLASNLSSKGQNVANVISVIVGILAVIGMMIGAGYFAVRKSNEGKQWLSGGAVGLVVAGSVYSIAALFI